MRNKKNQKIIDKNIKTFTKEIRKRYERIVKSDWFRKHYENKSLGEVIDVVDEM